MTAQHHNTEEDTILLNLYLSSGVELFAICDELCITYSELERRLQQPHIKEAIERATRLHEQRARTLARCRSDDAVCTLSYLASQPEINPETRRKAANQLLRAASAKGSEQTTTAASVSDRTTATATVRERTGRPSDQTRHRPVTPTPLQAPSPPVTGHGDTRLAPSQPGVHTYRLHPFTHPRITRINNPLDDPRPP